MKFRQSLQNIVNLIKEQITFIQDMERDMLYRLRTAVTNQQLRELSVCERVISMIQEHIAQCEPIVFEWLIAPDALAVDLNAVVYQAPPVDAEHCQ